eukprot:764039-Hanusia_phi.AAC.1
MQVQVSSDEARGRRGRRVYRVREEEGNQGQSMTEAGRARVSELLQLPASNLEAMQEGATNVISTRSLSSATPQRRGGEEQRGEEGGAVDWRSAIEDNGGQRTGAKNLTFRLGEKDRRDD